MGLQRERDVCLCFGCCFGCNRFAIFCVWGTKEKIALKWLAALANFKPSPNIDVIIPTKNNPEILDECLKSFSNSTNTENIYIIDNGSGVEELCKKYNVPVEVVEV